MSVLRVKNGDQWDIVPAIKGDTGDPAADESITDAMLVPDGIKTEIDWLWGNQLMDIREGELLQTDDAYEGPLVSLDVDGKSTQVTTTGKNLFDKNTAYAGWYINSSGIRANGSTNSCTDFIPVVGGNTYAFSYGAALSAGNYIAWYTDADQSTVTGNRVDACNLQNIVATAPSDAKYVRFSFQTSYLGKIQLEAGSSATAYEPYTGGKPAPNPDYPQEIVSVDAPTLAFAGKNLLDTTIWVENKYIGPSGNIGGENGQHYTENYSAVLPGTYCLSMLRNTGGRIRLHGYDSSKNWVQQLHAASVDSGNYYYSTALTIPDGIAYVRLSSAAAITNQQLELGSTRTDYAPFTVGLISIPLLPDGYSLRSLPNGTKDELHLSYLRPSTREGWAWYDRELVKRVGSLLFPEISWTYREAGVDPTGQAQSRFTCRLNAFGLGAGIRPTNSFCSAYAVQNNSGDRSTIFNDGTIYQLINYATLYQNGVNDSRFNNVADFLAANENTVIMASLITPITTQLDPIELPIMPSKDTTIWSDPSAQLKVTYIQDTNLVIESLEAAVADMATS